MKQIWNEIKIFYYELLDNLYRVFKLEYNLLWEKYNEYRYFVKSGKKTHYVYFIDSISNLTKVFVDTDKNQNSNKFKDDCYKRVKRIFELRQDLIIKYFDQPNFNLKSAVNLIEEYNSTTNSSKEQQPLLINEELTKKKYSESNELSYSFKIDELSNNANNSQTTKFNKEEYNASILKKLKPIALEIIKEDKQQGARIGYIVIEEGLIIPEKKTGKARLYAWNNFLGLEGEDRIIEEALIKNPLNTNGGRNRTQNLRKVKELIPIFEKIGWDKGAIRVEKVLNS